ncbi:SelB C-terminal domain-containing protein, partial [Micromonospora sp. RTP1Z1]|uniref:SelB domain-containing protein n=1 Tax=Micromonospora sp. RTP1Z1 TaxID=2994043 RepID=UPI0029C7A710
GLHSLNAAQQRVDALARVAVNLRGVSRDRLARGDALLSPGRFRLTDLLDVRLAGDPAADLPATLTLHVGSAAVPARVRPLGPDTVRLRLARPLPLLIGDRALLRDPGRHHVAGGVTVLDVAPPPLRRRGAATARATVLAGLDGRPDLAGELRRRALVRAGELTRMGVPVTVAPVAGDWLADREHWRLLGVRLTEEVTRYAAEHPLEPGVPVDVLRQRLALPDRAVVEALLRPPLRLRAGRVTAVAVDALPEPVARAVDRVRAEYGDRPFQAPETHRLGDLGLGPREIGAAVRAGVLLRVAENVVLLPGALDDAVRVLARLPQPFTLSAARQALDTTRRVAVPLLELLDRRGATRRLPDDAREVVAPPG